jgi:hypothetical protein
VAAEIDAVIRHGSSVTETATALSNRSHAGSSSAVRVKRPLFHFNCPSALICNPRALTFYSFHPVSPVKANCVLFW